MIVSITLYTIINIMESVFAKGYVSAQTSVITDWWSMLIGGNLPFIGDFIREVTGHIINFIVIDIPGLTGIPWIIINLINWILFSIPFVVAINTAYKFIMDIIPG